MEEDKKFGCGAGGGIIGIDFLLASTLPCDRNSLQNLPFLVKSCAILSVSDQALFWHFLSEIYGFRM